MAKPKRGLSTTVLLNLNFLRLLDPDPFLSTYLP